MHRKLFNALTIVVLLASMVVLPIGASSPEPPTQKKVVRPEGVTTEVTTASEANLAKFNPALQQVALMGGEDTVDVRILTDGKDVDWQGLVQAVPRNEPDALTGLTVWYGRAKASDLAKMSGLDFVAEARFIEEYGAIPRYRPDDQPQTQMTEESRARLRALRDNPPAANPRAGAQGWWDVGPGHESKEAWDKGYTGTDVRVAVIDSGVDFAHPDLMGTWAVYSENLSNDPYYDYFVGWPVAFSPASNYLMAFDYRNNQQLTHLNAFAYGASNFADTSIVGVGKEIEFGGKVYKTSETAHADNPVYHIGYHPDRMLEVVWGERIAVLVVDESGDGVYDTVYVDLNANHDFTDDKPVNKQSPVSYWDADMDSYADVSGGLVYFIADGHHWPQGFDWWWSWAVGPSRPMPGNGDLVAFMFSNAFSTNHGQLCASNVVGQGVIDGEPPAPNDTRPDWKPTGAGGMVQGAGKNAKVVAVGDAYVLFTSSTEDAWYFAARGVDGDYATDDGAHITSNSFGSSGTDNDEWDFRSRLVAYLNASGLAKNVTFMFSTGNGAPGYGTSAPPSPSTGVAVGASTQFGTTGWDSITGTDQIVWGDVIPWSNRGPSAAGHLAPDITADGAYAAGALALNESGDGWTAWTTWGGTSRSAPVAAGNMALIYDAWKQKTGDWPTWEEARAVMMSGATDQMNDVLVQGAGMVNADRATDIAGGHFGLLTSPNAWSPGDYRGVDYPGFAQLIAPGGSDSQVFTVTNMGDAALTVPLTSTYFTKISSVEFTATSVLSDEADYDFFRPDMLFDVSEYAPSGVPSDTVLMVAEVLQPFDEFATGNTALGNVWRVYWYSHKDVNGDNNLWTDDDSNGNVGVDEIDQYEYVRLNYSGNWHTYHQASVKDPLNRWKDGIYLGLQHRVRTDDVPVSNLQIRVTFYQKSTWDWLSFDMDSVTVPAMDAAAFEATATIPNDAPYGVYEGAIEMAVPTSGDYDAYNAVIPVVINVAFSGDATAAPIMLGGMPKADTPYDNSFVSGSQDWTWRPESGDWRFYFLDQTITPTLGTNLLIRDEWGDAAPETDIDTLVFGPNASDYCQERALRYCFGELSQYLPDFFGPPYRLEQTGGSVNQYLGSGVWGFDTATGGNVEYVTAPLYEGLNEIMQHTVRFEGDKFEVPFTKTVSTLSGPAVLEYEDYFTDVISFSANMTHTGGLTVTAYGMGRVTDYFYNPITQDPTNGTACDWDMGGVWTTTTTVEGVVSELGALVYVGSNDLDLYVLYDANDDGTFACGGEIIGSSTNGAGTNDEVVVSWPAEGDYLILVQGWDVSPSPSTFNLDLWQVKLDDSITTRNENLAINPDKDATFELYNKPGACDDTRGMCNRGVLYVGLQDAPNLMEIPIIVFYTGPNVSVAKSVDKMNAGVGDVLEYTVTLYNNSMTAATGAMMTDTLPSELDFGGIVSGGATFEDGMVKWTGEVPGAQMLTWMVPGMHTIVFTATVNATAESGTYIQNMAEANSGLGKLATSYPVRTYIGAYLYNSEKSVEGGFASMYSWWNMANPGDTLTYTIQLINEGPISTTAMVTDVLPMYVTYVPGSATGGATYDADLNAILWSGSTVIMPTPNDYSFTYQVTINPDTPDGTTIYNDYIVSADEGMWYSWYAQTDVQAPVMNTSDKGANKVATSVAASDVITFEVLINNTGSYAAHAMMMDPLPQGLTLLDTPEVVGPGLVSPADSTLLWSNNTVTWTGTLLPGGSAVVRFPAQINGDVNVNAQRITNIATIYDGFGAMLEVDYVFGKYPILLPVVMRNN